ncbi:MAG: DUF169 domain-containing protein [Desulfovibrio sp.]|jgi:uncharacterized protein (DUF169 family)|nr:DUF169 domain-containing protein [Desulfovibrio sp.]
MSQNYREMEDILMQELRLYHHPVAVTWLFTDDDVANFKSGTTHVTPVKPITFCQWEIAARMQGLTVVAGREDLACANARASFGWKDIDATDVRHLDRYCVDPAQAERFLRSKPRLPMNSLRGIAVGPLGKATVAPHVIHFYCDNMQSYHLAVDYMAATDTHPLRPLVSMSSAACGGAAFCWMEKTFNLSPCCSGSYNAGKTERGEVNAFIPGEHLELTVNRLLQRIDKFGSSALTRPGDPFPGADICKNCPLIAFKQADNCPETCGCRNTC